MIKEFLDLNKDKVYGIIMGVEILLLLLGIFGIFVDINLGREINNYKINANKEFGLGTTEDIGGQKVHEYTIKLGSFTQSCINNISVKSVKPSEGDIIGVTLCNGQKITLQSWIIEIEEVFSEKNEAIMRVIKLTFVPSWILFILFGLILGVTLLVRFLLNKKRRKSSKK